MLEIRTTNGSTVKIQGAGLKALEIGLDEMFNPIKRVYEDALGDVKEEAEKNFPYDFRRRDYNDNKPHARDQFRIGTKKIIEGGNLMLQTSLYNDSEYAYMIKTSKKFVSQTGSGSKVPLPQGSHVFTKLLWQPIVKASLKVARETANIFISTVKRAS